MNLKINGRSSIEHLVDNSCHTLIGLVFKLIRTIVHQKWRIENSYGNQQLLLLKVRLFVYDDNGCNLGAIGNIFTAFKTGLQDHSISHPILQRSPFVAFFFQFVPPLSGSKYFSTWFIMLLVFQPIHPTRILFHSAEIR